MPWATLVVAALLLIAAGCRSVPSADSATATGDTAARTATPISIYANPGVRVPLDKLTVAYVALNPGIRFDITYLTTDEIVTRLNAGNRADIVIDTARATAGPLAQWRAQAEKNLAFGATPLEIAVAPGNPRGITSITSLLDPALRLGLCDPTKACGGAAAQQFKAAGITVPSTAVRGTAEDLAKQVVDGTLDAALLYRSDRVTTSGNALEGVPLRPDLKPDAPLQIMPINRTAVADPFRIWMYKDPAADAILTETGFRPLLGVTDTDPAAATEPSTSAPA